jgi:chorismate mutase
MPSAVLREYVADLKKKKGRSLVDTVRGCNTRQFVDALREDGLSNDEVEDFFEAMVEHCLAEGAILPQRGYLNMVKFAARKGLLKED